MHQFIYLIQIIVAILLIIVILLQQKGAGLGSTFGGGESSVYRAKRGAERMLFYATIVLTIVFIVLSLVGLAL